MPTYDYRCSGCGHTWELFQSMTAKHEKLCPSCGKKKAERLIGTGSALLFKGSGFYQTDYRSEGYKKSAEADKASPTSGTQTEAPSKGADTAGGAGTNSGSEVKKSAESVAGKSEKSGSRSGVGKSSASAVNSGTNAKAKS